MARHGEQLHECMAFHDPCGERIGTTNEGLTPAKVARACAWANKRSYRGACPRRARQGEKASRRVQRAWRSAESREANQAGFQKACRNETLIERGSDVSIYSDPETFESWEQAMPRCRERWQTRYGNAATCWDDVEPMYRYGHEQRARPEYRGRRWDELVPAFRRGWGKRYPNTPWNRASEGVRDAWEDARASVTDS